MLNATAVPARESESAMNVETHPTSHQHTSPEHTAPEPHPPTQPRKRSRPAALAAAQATY
jgi:hypothetical protein